MVRQVLSDESLNDRGFRVMNESIKWDRYLKNPVLVEQHMSWEPPIGRIDDIKLENDAWTGVLVFASTEKGKMYEKLYNEGCIRAVSIGGNAVIVENERREKKTKSFDVFEVSLVTIPSNANAVKHELGHIPVEYKLYCDKKEFITLSSNFEELNNMEEEKEKKYTGIANEFSISINTVKTHISKAYRLIRFPIDPALPSRYQIQKAFER